MVKDAIYFLLPLLASSAVSFWLGWYSAASALIGLALFVAFFFRDPERAIPDGDGIIVSPADGRIVRIEDSGNKLSVSIFLSIFDVHVNRSPIGGRILAVDHRPGKFRAAFNDLASVENESNTLVIEGNGLAVECTQIAGIVARRIVCWKKPGDTVERGERIGLIRFGSRTDLLLPRSADLKVGLGDRVRGGNSVIAVLKPNR